MNFKKRKKGDKKKNTVVIAAALLLFLVIAGGMIYRQIQGHQVKEAWAERLERGEERRARKAAEAEEAMAESEGVLDFSMESGMDVLEAVDGRPLEVELTEETAEDFLKIEPEKSEQYFWKVKESTYKDNSGFPVELKLKARVNINK